MKHPMIRIALIAALTTPLFTASAMAQNDDEFDVFGITNDGTSLDELVPDTDELPPPQPYVEDSAKASVDPEPTISPTPVPTAEITEPAGPPAIAAFSAPSDWVSHEINGFRFQAPPDWGVVTDRSDAFLLFDGNMETRTGTTFGILFERTRLTEDEDAVILVQADVTMPNGEIYLRAELQHEELGGVAMQAVSYISPTTNADDDYPTIAMATMNQPFETSRAVLENILGTLTMPSQYVKPRDAGLDGMVTFDVPRSWRISRASDNNQIAFAAPYFPGYFEIAMRNWVTDEGGMNDEVPDRASAPEPAEIFGYAAMRQTWKGTTPEFFVGTTAVPGEFTFYRLSQCLPDGGPITVLFAGAPDFLNGAEFTAAVASVDLTLPQGMIDCAAAPAVATAPTPVPDPAPVTTTAPVKTAPTNTAPDPAAIAGTKIDIEGVTFLLPDGWVATYDSPSDKMFESPDGMITILAFWWFPDEPLTGYDDDISMKHVIIDHEPVTQITSHIAERFTVQNVSERARADEKRFIFTVESGAMGLADLQALNESLVKNLRLQPALDPDWQEPAQPVVSPAPVISASAPAPVPSASAPAPTSGALPENVRFGRSGIGKWRGEFVTLSNPGSGSPDGGGALEAKALGDGENGYFLAPGYLLGDWRGANGLQLVLRLLSGNGSYYSPYVDGARGDIFIQNGDMSAMIEFDHPVGSKWTTQTVMFDDPRWRLSGNASSVRDILANVTRFDVRAEYLNGDTRAALASIDWLAVAISPPPQQLGKSGKQPSLDPGWQHYSNSRFGTQINYPADLFAPLPPPENNDGRSFSGINGAQKFYVFGQFNIDVLGISALLDRDVEQGGYSHITEKIIGADWYVLSGRLGKNDFYRKVLLDTENDILQVFEISYPSAQKSIYDLIVPKMAGSFSGP